MGIMLVRKLSKTNAAFQLSNLPAALKIERSIGRLQRRVAKVSPKWEEEKTQAKCLKWMSMRCGEQKTMAMAMASTFLPPPSCSTKLNSWAKWLALLIRPAPAQRWWLESHGSAQANGQIVNVEPSAKLTCQTDYMSWPQPKATQTTDGRTDWLTDWSAVCGIVSHFGFIVNWHFCSCTRQRFAALAPVASQPRVWPNGATWHARALVRVCFMALWQWQLLIAFALLQCGSVAASRTVSTLFTRPVLSLLQIEIVATLVRFMSARCMEKGSRMDPARGAALPLINCQRKLISS